MERNEIRILALQMALEFKKGYDVDASRIIECAEIFREYMEPAGSACILSPQTPIQMMERIMEDGSF